MGDDGNFELWNRNKTISFWSTKTNGSIGARLYLQIDGNLRVKNLARQSLWTSETTTFCPGNTACLVESFLYTVCARDRDLYEVKNARRQGEEHTPGNMNGQGNTSTRKQICSSHNFLVN
jgi:hypothetical protein